jgi:hypothetical protein
MGNHPEMENACRRARRRIGPAAAELQWRYQIEHTETGEVKTVATLDEYDVGDKLSDDDCEDVEP